MALFLTEIHNLRRISPTLNISQDSWTSYDACIRKGKQMHGNRIHNPPRDTIKAYK